VQVIREVNVDKAVAPTTELLIQTWPLSREKLKAGSLLAYGYAQIVYVMRNWERIFSVVGVEYGN
jgi:hypothetical protein